MTKVYCVLVLSFLLSITPPAEAAPDDDVVATLAKTEGFEDAPELQIPRLVPSLSCESRHPEQNRRSDPQWGRVLTDIARRLPETARYEDAYRRYIRAGDLVTAGHEWTHFLNEYLSLQADAGQSCFYLLDGRAFTLAEPEGLRGIVPPVPPSLRGELYDLYLVQNAGNARISPLYLFDEWSAYANDVTLASDQLENGKPLNALDPGAMQTHTAANVIEFMFYGFSVGMAVKQHDPDYYAGRSGRQLREFITLVARRSLEAHGRALQHPALCRGDDRNMTLINNFQSSPDAAALRNWVRSDIGEYIANIIAGIEIEMPTLSKAASRTARRSRPTAG